MNMNTSTQFSLPDGGFKWLRSERADGTVRYLSKGCLTGSWSIFCSTVDDQCWVRWSSLVGAVGTTINSAGVECIDEDYREAYEWLSAEYKSRTGGDGDRFDSVYEAGQWVDSLEAEWDRRSEGCEALQTVEVDF